MKGKLSLYGLASIALWWGRLLATALVLPDPLTTEFGANLINGARERAPDLRFQDAHPTTDLYADLQHGWGEIKDKVAGGWSGEDEEDGGSLPPFVKVDGDKNHDGTIYDYLVKSKYFTKLARAVQGDEELSDLLKSKPKNGLTLFAPTDSSLPDSHRHRGDHGKDEYEDAVADILAAFGTDVLPLSDEDHRRPPKEVVRAIVKYHVVPSYGYTFEDLRSGYNVTLATAFTSHHGFLHDEPQRLTLGLNGLGVTVNFFSRVIYKYADQRFENGVLHPINFPLIPPPSLMQTLWYAPQLFSTLTSAIQKVNATSLFQYKIKELTAFGPINAAWNALPPKALAFLFSPFGAKYLKGLLAYHVVPGVYLAPDYFHRVNKTKESEIVQDTSSLVQALEDLLDRFKVPCHKALPGTKHQDEFSETVSTSMATREVHAHYRLPTGLTFILEHHRKNDSKFMSSAEGDSQLDPEDFFTTLSHYLDDDESKEHDEHHRPHGGKYDTHLYVDTYRRILPPRLARLPRLVPASRVKVNGQTVAVPNVVARNGIAHAIGKVLIPKKYNNDSD